MPPIARTYVKTAFLYFLGAFALGMLILLDRWLGFSRWLKVVYVSQLHLLMVGWLTQLALGVAYWILPRFLKEDNPQPRGADGLAWFVWSTLNAGLLLRFLVEPFYLLGPKPWLAATLAFSGILQMIAAFGFGWLVWGRIRAMEP